MCGRVWWRLGPVRPRTGLSVVLIAAGFSGLSCRQPLSSPPRPLPWPRFSELTAAFGLAAVFGLGADDFVTAGFFATEADFVAVFFFAAVTVLVALALVAFFDGAAALAVFGFASFLGADLAADFVAAAARVVVAAFRDVCLDAAAGPLRVVVLAPADLRAAALCCFDAGFFATDGFDFGVALRRAAVFAAAGVVRLTDVPVERDVFLPFAGRLVETRVAAVFFALLAVAAMTLSASTRRRARFSLPPK